jgi:hypothetical protein
MWAETLSAMLDTVTKHCPFTAAVQLSPPPMSYAIDDVPIETTPVNTQCKTVIVSLPMC